MKFLTVDNSAEIIGSAYKGRMLINGERTSWWLPK
ncbi:UNVERIFIED_ORG: hypothetical protein J2W87_002472 [Pseudomonas putida]|jgi:hypothetical protein|nr:hypothetical protein [Pseudomonas putida]